MPFSGANTHRALFYRDDNEYLEGISGFLRPAVEAGEPIAFAVPEHKLQLIREQLCYLSNKQLLDMSEVGRNPGRLLSITERLGHEHRGQTLHYIGEPIWPGRSAEEIREAVRHEALTNFARGEFPVRFLCPYDSAALDAAVLASAERTHP